MLYRILFNKKMGKGGKSLITKPSEKEFFQSQDNEPHAKRRKIILEKYPEISKLFGNDVRVVPVVVVILFSQLFLAYFSKYFSWPVFVAIAWVYGGAASHALSLMTHEVAHNLVFESPQLNEYFGMFCNIGMGFPSSTMFKRYHMEHHQFQGDKDKDVDIPSRWEGDFIGNSTFRKFIYLCLLFIAYGARPGYVRPKKYSSKEYTNIVLIVTTDLLILFFCGFSGVLYMFLSLALGMGLHPVAGHFISEHYVFADGEGFETFSYYGALNWICWNVGYHNEHHDFPRVPGWKLPQVKAIAPEFYETLPSHKSWTYVLWRFVTDPTVTPYSRVVRSDGKQ